MVGLRVGVIGAGRIAQRQISAWRAVGAEVGTLAYDPPFPQEAAGASSPFDALDDLLSWVDIVHVCAPADSRRDLCLAAIGAGRSLVCEQPLGRTFDEALMIARASLDAGVSVLPSQVGRFVPERTTLQAAVSSGRIGTPAILRFTCSVPSPSPDAGAPTLFDLVAEVLIEDLDLARWIAGEVTGVYAVANSGAGDGQGPSTMVAQVTLTHAEGAITHLQGQCGPPGLERRSSFDVAGHAGRLTFRSEASGLVIDNPPGAGLMAPGLADESPELAQIRAYVSTLRAGAPSPVSLLDGVAAVGLAEAVSRSAGTGQPVAFEDYLTRLEELSSHV
ncbi:Gfo/Idh/MocA family oxidoreductase [Microlunatus panaciterrae]|uniref:Myo-inositol 2-dehydrogenase/D-chiro-inositol 1-dehydrogenase n=1 Tax=Microlunatus panaciterrae TaxID=400768 RepID=A0ABS2RES4_9ACTN|nr:myo-inositol 2-dehydrogenase/D-chiro-inositol 1-dehydrogenase [Microlunatus panaciterrae]